MNNVIEKIKKTLRAYDPDIKFSDSSALSSLMINPLSAILSPYEDELNTYKREQSLLNPEAISETEMDKYAANFSITRVQGAKATGYVKIFFKSPRTLFIPQGVYFETADGKKYNVVGAYSITESQMRLNSGTDYPYYSTGSIPIISATSGVDYETGPGTINKVFGLSVDYAYVRNPVAITGGETRETNTQLKARILDSGINGSIFSTYGISKILINNFPSLTNVTVIGADDDEMERDLVYVTSSGELLSVLPYGFYRSDFFGAVSGYQDPPANRCTGYWGIFYVEVTTGDQLLASEVSAPDNFTDEWPTQWYTQIYKVNDAYYQTINTDRIFEEYFTDGKASNESWVKSDGTTVDGRLISPDEIGVESGAVRLGKTLLVDGHEQKTIILTPAKVEQLNKVMEELKKKGRDRKELE